jgi:SAM-dependent methyltransferase
LQTTWEAPVESQSIDAVEFREAQRDSWNTASSGWKKWNEQIDAATRSVNERLVELAGVKSGDRVLDIACGYGEPSLTAAGVVGPEGSVVATDISPGMLAFGRERAANRGLENVEFIESGANSLELPAQSFDAAVSRWGIIFEPDGEGTASRVRGFLKEGARMAISSWGPPERVAFIAVPMRTALQTLNVPPPPPGTPGPLSRPTPDALGGLLEGGGFSDVSVEEIEITWEFDSPEQFTEYTQDIVAPITAMVSKHPPEVQQETWAAITEAVREYAGEDGRVRFPSLVLAASGRA